MKRNFHELLEEADVALPSDRSTGLVLASAAILVAVTWRHNPLAMVPAIALGSGLAVLSVMAPARLHRLNRAWMGLGRLMGKVVNPIVMLVLFCTTIVPFGLAMQLKRDPLRRKLAAEDETFWGAPEAQAARSDMTRQF
jgi:hypothetical protein